MTETPLRKSLALRGLFGLLLQLILRLRGLLIIPVLTRALPPSELGVISLGNALVAGLAPLLVLGMHSGLSLRVVRLEGEEIRPAILTVLSFSAVFSVAVTVLLLSIVSTGLFGGALKPLLPVLLPVGLFAIGISLREISTVLPQVRQELRFIAGINIFMDFGGAIAALLFVFAGWGAYGVLLGVGSLSLVGVVVAAIYSLKSAPGVWAWDSAFLKAALRTALPAVPLSVGHSTLQFSDYFLVSYYRSVSDLATYGLAYNLASPTLMAIAAINLTYLPTCVEILQKGQDAFARFVDKSMILFAVGGIAAISFATSAGPALAAWFGGAIYTESGRLLPIVVAGYVFFSLSQLQQFVPGAMIQDMQASARAYLVAAVVNVATNFLLIPRFGMWGAAWSTLGSYALAFVLLSRSVRALLPELRWMSRISHLVALTALSVGFALPMQSRATGPISALLFGGGAALVTVGLAFALRLLDRSDVERLRAFRPFAAS